jgi:hypothetical protein
MLLADTKKELVDIVNLLPNDKSKEVYDFALFLLKYSKVGSKNIKLRPIGTYDGEIKIKDNFYKPLPSKIMKLFGSGLK